MEGRRNRAQIVGKHFQHHAGASTRSGIAEPSLTESLPALPPLLSSGAGTRKNLQRMENKMPEWLRNLFTSGDFITYCMDKSGKNCGAVSVLILVRMLLTGPKEF